MTKIRVEVPDALTGMFLSERLRRDAVVGVRDGHGWEVLVDDDGPAEDVLNSIRDWVRTGGRERATVYVDGKAHTLSADS